jgi:hypothetical protein
MTMARRGGIARACALLACASASAAAFAPPPAHAFAAAAATRATTAETRRPAAANNTDVTSSCVAHAAERASAPPGARLADLSPQRLRDAYPHLRAPPPPTLVGTFTNYTNALPNQQLPAVPLLGNGATGIALDAWNQNNASAPATAGPGRNNTLDLWLNTNANWECTACANPSPAGGCCSKIALGGVSISLIPTFGQAVPLAFGAVQRIGDGALLSTWTTPHGGVFATTTHIHPQLDIVVTNMTWAPGSSGGRDPAALAVDVQTWVVGPDPSAPGVPTPSAIGCADASGNPQECASGQQSPLQLVYASRLASSDPASPHVQWTALATGWAGAGATLTDAAVVQQTEDVWAVSTRVNLLAGGPAALVTVLSATSFSAASGAPQPQDPYFAALKALVQVLGAPDAPAAVPAAATAWWAAFWAEASVSAPTQPGAQDLWLGAQYILACTASNDASVPGPALYGVWCTSDWPNWYGDMTLDYNYEATFFGAVATHVAHAVSYFGSVVDWMPAARKQAAQQAAAANVQCPADALHYACHLAPWGFQSQDTSVYMHWNGERLLQR